MGRDIRLCIERAEESADGHPLPIHIRDTGQHVSGELLLDVMGDIDRFVVWTRHHIVILDAILELFRVPLH